MAGLISLLSCLSNEARLMHRVVPAPRCDVCKECGEAFAASHEGSPCDDYERSPGPCVLAPSQSADYRCALDARAGDWSRWDDDTGQRGEETAKGDLHLLHPRALDLLHPRCLWRCRGSGAG